MKTLPALLLLILPATGFADGERDNDPAKVRQVPRPGIKVSHEQAELLRSRIAKLGTSIAELQASESKFVQRHLPDVLIFHRAARCALGYNEFFHERDVRKAFKLLDTAMDRAKLLAQGTAPWTQTTGLQVFGFVSKIDKTVQPYGLVIPDSYKFNAAREHRCDLWFHGRGETLSEVNFLDQRLNNAGQYQPTDAIVLHPYGRYSNAFKFAGEIDVLEALEDAQKRFRIDEDRISARGFSMGGAACWQFAVHYSDRWFAANPGAGFSETPEFLKSFQKEKLNPTWYEKKLWQWYDCPDYAANLLQCPTVAYSGELDVQKQAADIMAPAFEREGLEMVHIIGPKTKHSIHPDSMRDIEHRMSLLARNGRNRTPNPLRFTTFTTRYNRMHWIEVTGLQEHWKPARVNAEWSGNRIGIHTENVTGLVVSFPSGHAPFQPGKVTIAINGHESHGLMSSDQSFRHAMHTADGRWHSGELPNIGRRKRHGLQGPIDDAFMDSFVFVPASGKSGSGEFGRWQRSELAHAVKHWRQQFRGDAIVKPDSGVTDDDIANSNLVIWGDPSSNVVLKKIADKLPIKWDADFIHVGGKKFSSEHHALLMVYPNPLNPDRYVVLNSGFTYREYAYLNNARQVPMLPDWAVVDLRTPPGTQFPGKVVAADFFDEAWQLKPLKRTD